MININNAKKSKKFLRGLKYSLCRLQELKAYGLIKSEDMFEKANIAQSMGYEKDLPMRISTRLSDLFCVNNNSLEPVAFESKLAMLLQEYSEVEAIVAIQNSLIDLVNRQIGNVEALADEPTYLLLSDVKNILQKGIDKLELKSSASFNLQLDELSETLSARASFGDIPKLPGRPKTYTYNPVKDCNLEACINSDTELAKFIHFVAVHIEVCAMEVCSFNILEYPELPLQFRADMAQQIWDESRHFLIFADYLKRELNTEIGDYPYQLDVWFKHQKGDGLLEQLAIEQVLQEGDAVSNNLSLINGLKQLGKYPRLVELMHFVNADETVHTRIGNKWLTYLCEREGVSYMKVLNSAAYKIGKKIPSGALLAPRMLEFLGFPTEYQEKVSST